MLSFKDLYQPVARRLGDFSATGKSIAREAINRAQREISLRQSWGFLIDQKAFVQTTTYSTGTVDVTSNSFVVTGNATSFDRSFEGRTFRLSGVDITYRVAAYVSATSLRLDRPYAGSTASAGEYEIYKNEYELPRDTQSVLRMWVPEVPRTVDPVPVQKIHEFDQTVEGTADPEYYASVGGTDKPYYTTGTVTLTEGSATVTGSGTTFDSTMVGRHFRVKGEMRLYLIRSQDSTTQLTLDENFRGQNGDTISYEIDPPGKPLVRIWPRPSAARNIYIVRQRVPRELFDDDEAADFPDEFGDLLIAAGEYRALNIMGADPNLIQFAMQQYERQFKDASAKAKVHGADYIPQAGRWGSTPTKSSFPGDWPFYRRT